MLLLLKKILKSEVNRVMIKIEIKNKASATWMGLKITKAIQAMK